MTEEELAKHDSKTLLQLLLSADARCDALTAQLAEDADARALMDDRLEQLVAQVDALTAERDEARKKFNDTDLCWNGVAPCGWSLTLIDKADKAEAERDRLREALRHIVTYLAEPTIASEDTLNSLRGDLRFVGRVASAALKGETP